MVVNALNPHPYLFWLAVGAPTVVKAWHTMPVAAVLSLLGFYGSLTGVKVVVADGAARSRTLLKGKPYVYFLRGLGALLLVFAPLLA